MKRLILTAALLAAGPALAGERDYYSGRTPLGTVIPGVPCLIADPDGGCKFTLFETVVTGSPRDDCVRKIGRSHACDFSPLRSVDIAPPAKPKPPAKPRPPAIIPEPEPETPSVIPLPASVLFLLSALAGLGVVSRRRRG